MSSKEGNGDYDQPIISDSIQLEPVSTGVGSGSLSGSDGRPHSDQRDPQAVGAVHEGVVEAEPILVAEPVDPNQLGALQLTSTQLTLGPIPAPWVLRDYDALVPGTAAKIIDAHLHGERVQADALDRSVKADSNSMMIGAIAAPAIALTGLVSGVALIIAGHPIYSIAAIIPAILAGGAQVIAASRKTKD